MRRIASISIILLLAAFGVVIDVGHVHPSEDHHQDASGLHLDHVHAGLSIDRDNEDHEHEGGHPHRQESDGDSDSARHEGGGQDATYLSLPLGRTTDAGTDAPVAIAAHRALEVDTPTRFIGANLQNDAPVRPPCKGPPGSRAPPA